MHVLLAQDCIYAYAERDRHTGRAVPTEHTGARCACRLRHRAPRYRTRPGDRLLREVKHIQDRIFPEAPARYKHLDEAFTPAMLESNNSMVIDCPERVDRSTKLSRDLHICMDHTCAIF